MTIIENIKDNIERRIHSIENCPFIEAEFGASEKREGKLIAYKELLSFISALEKSEKPMNQEELDQEIIKCWQEWISPSNKQSVDGILPLSEFAFYARHFAQWQKEQDNIISRQAEAERIKTQQMCYEKGQSDMKRQMMKEAVEGKIRGDIRNQEEKPYQIWAESDYLPLNEKFEIGDKVHVIIVNKENE